MLLGSTVPAGHAPYVPTGVLEGKISVEEARKSRELKIIFAALPLHYTLPLHYGLEKWFAIPVLFEPLNGKGETIRNPRPVDKGALAELLSQGMLVEEAIEASLIKGWAKSPGFPEDREGR